MIRFLLLLAFGYLLYRLIFHPPRIGFFGPAGKRFKRKPSHPDAEEMVPCAQCGTFISKREAENNGGRYFCRPKCLNSMPKT